MEKKVKKKVVNQRPVVKTISPKQHLDGQMIVEAALHKERITKELEVIEARAIAIKAELGITDKKPRKKIVKGKE